MKKFFSLPVFILLFTMLTLQSGCLKDGRNTEYADVTAVNDTIYGTLKFKQKLGGVAELVDWPFGQANISAIAGISGTLAVATVDTAGTFMLILPGTVPGAYLSSLAGVADSQGGTIQCVPNTVRYLSTVQFRVEYSDHGVPAGFIANLYTLNVDLSIKKSYFYNFYDMDGTFSGTGATGNIFFWPFVKGWGMVESFKISAASDAFNTRSVVDAPSDAIWMN